MPQPRPLVRISGTEPSQGRVPEEVPLLSSSAETKPVPSRGGPVNKRYRAIGTNSAPVRQKPNCGSPSTESVSPVAMCGAAEVLICSLIHRNGLQSTSRCHEDVVADVARTSHVVQEGARQTVAGPTPFLLQSANKNYPNPTGKFPTAMSMMFSPSSTRALPCGSITLEASNAGGMSIFVATPEPVRPPGQRSTAHQCKAACAAGDRPT